VGDWTPFDKNGKLNVTLVTDSWWKRAKARLRREPIWHQMGALREEEWDNL